MSALTHEPRTRPERAAEEWEIRDGGYAAVVTLRGAALRKLTHHGRDLVVPFGEDQPIPDYRGAIAAPWPNRMADGLYRFDRTIYHVPVNEPERNCALHGLVFDLDWEVISFDSRSVTLAVELCPSQGYPFALRLEATYTVSGEAPEAGGGLSWEVRTRNLGPGPAPYGVCPHPYLVAGASPLDDWELEIPAERFLEVTQDRLLPVAEQTVDGHAFDFRRPRRIGSTEMDHAFTGISFEADGTARVVMRDPVHRTGVAMAWDPTCQWLQIHTADKKPPSPNRLGLAVEPMTCPPDALNSGIDLVRIEPGALHTARWRICVADQVPNQERKEG